MATIGVALMGVVLLAGACGGGSPSGVAARPTTTVRPVPPSSAGGDSASTDPSTVPSTTPTTSSEPAPSTTEGGSQSATSQALAFAQCMRSHGVPDFPDPAPAGGFKVNGLGPELRSPTFQAAQRACEKADPAGSGIPTGTERTQDLSHLLHYAECMRAHGIVNFPDPTVHPDGGPGFMFTQPIDQNSPAFQSADQVCQHLLPGGGDGHL